MTLWRAVAVSCALAAICFVDEGSLHGTHVYDDGGTIKDNLVVRRPWTKQEPPAWAGNDTVWAEYGEWAALVEEIKAELHFISIADFWGTELATPQSHKSFRPVATLTYRINYLLSGDDLFWYHVVNRVLHVVITGLATVLSHRALESDDGFSTLVAGLLFALHPIHGEAVCNLTGRAELLMSLFYLLGVLVYLRSVEVGRARLHTIWTSLKVAIFPLICTALALLSKETGIILPVTCIVCDFCRERASIPALLSALLPNKNEEKEESNDGESKIADTNSTERAARVQDMRWLIARAVVLFSGTIGIGIWRLSLNGEGKPNLIVDQNPAAFAEDRFTRIMSVNYIYFSYMESFVFPKWLAPDWSGPSIPLIETVSDPRICLVVGFWIWLFGSLTYALAVRELDRNRRAVLQSVLGYTVAPFFMASNLLVITGTMKAERVAYLPSLGPCMLAAFCVDLITRKMGRKLGQPPSCLVQGALLAVLLVLTFRTSERQHAWSDPYHLWESAAKINPRSWHTWYNYGVQLVRHNRPQEAEALFWKVKEARSHDFANRYVLGVVLRAQGRCDEVLELADESIEMLEMDRPGENKLRLNKKGDKAYMLTLKSYCAPTIAEMSIYAQEAILTDPSNSAARDRVEELSKLAVSLGLSDSTSNKKVQVTEESIAKQMESIEAHKKMIAQQQQLAQQQKEDQKKQ
ncbi:Transmembrane and TPR repeat-containing protein 4 [Hondaea fermentalgiana]|uniref:Transmembrane and TPR repeat-containing protein 4 n=1 Tax=Hondaea fermentalgiana TaxID=2315210 RepID=A0A2R5GRG2_9STRA|nr:Transmembrane and TPR repeat-containing protein 4 [Hondaea fermentalgiana]|eukprot:GBG33185.1 Transmembrane and TPR repeat-containing protein 4 [Hondaea fermentalgiana]